MTVASKTPIHHRQHKTAAKKSSLKSTLTAAFSRHATTNDALDEYTRSMRDYLEHSDDVDLQGRSSREPSPEFYWRDLSDIKIPNGALTNSSRHESNASSFRPPQSEYSSSHHTDTDEDPSSETSSLSSRISAMHLGVPAVSNSNGAVVAPTREQQAAAARNARIAQHQQQYNVNRVGGAGPAWHFYHAPTPKKKSSSPSLLRRTTSSSVTSSSSSSKKSCVK